MSDVLAGLKPMKISHLSDEIVPTLLAHDDWVLEQKMDGARVMIHVTRDDEGLAFDWRASSGEPLKFAAAAQHVTALTDDLIPLLKDIDAVVLDGELIVSTGVLWLFDMPYQRTTIGEWVTPASPYSWRRDMLRVLLEDGVPSGRVRKVRTAHGTDDKQALWQSINAAGVEGAILKRLDAPYESGVRTKNQFKAKLVKTADLVVTSVQRTFKPDGVTVHTGSAGLAIRVGEGVEVAVAGFPQNPERLTAMSYEYKPIASASLIGKDLSISVGDVVEVAYLYRDAKGGLIQPRIVTKRRPEEKRPEDCLEEQFPTYSREAV